MDPWHALQLRMNQLWREFDRELAPILRAGASSTVGIEDAKPSSAALVPAPAPAPARLVPLDLNETPDAIEVVAELPGIPRDAVRVHVAEDGTLHIRGERQRELRSPANDAFQFQERAWGVVQRSLRLPPTADPGHCDASFDNGVLTLRFRKRDVPGRLIELQ